jgi:hypothetical protein
MYAAVQSPGYVVVHHNDAVKTRCAGSGLAPVEGSVVHQSPGREIARGPRRDADEDR